MKTGLITFFVWIMLAPDLSLAGDLDNERQYRYSGDYRARQVCRAVQDNDVGSLKSYLRSYRGTLVNAYRYDLHGREVAGSFTCNDMGLEEFAELVNAWKASSYLSTGRVTADVEISSALPLP